MPFLRFDSESCGVDFVYEAPTHSKSRSGDPDDQKLIVTLTLTPEKLSALHSSLGEIHPKEGSELRCEFPDGWTIYWKIRSGESRFLVARPEMDQWVATLALSESHLKLIRAQIEGGAGGALSGFEPISRVSNFEVILAVRGRDTN